MTLRVLVLLIVVGAMAYFGGGRWLDVWSNGRREVNRAVERVVAAEARQRLGTILNAERRYHALASRFAAAWEDLDIADPNVNQGAFHYRVVRADAARFLAVAERASPPGQHTVSIDQDGVFTERLDEEPTREPREGL